MPWDDCVSGLFSPAGPDRDCRFPQGSRTASLREAHRKNVSPSRFVLWDGGCQPGCNRAHPNSGSTPSPAPKADLMNDKPDSVTIDRTPLKRLASWAALVVGALLMLWPVTLTVFGTTITGDPAVLFVLRTGELLAKMEELSGNP